MLPAVFDGYYQRDWKDSVPVAPDALISGQPDVQSVARDTPLALEEIPIVRVLNAGVALVDQPARPMPFRVCWRRAAQRGGDRCRAEGPGAAEG